MANRTAVTRRGFLGTAAAATALLAAGRPSRLLAGDDVGAEMLVAELFGTLSDEQRTSIVFPFDSPLREGVNNNWFILPEKRIATTFMPAQRDLVRKIFRSLHSDEYADAVLKQVEHDNAESGGFGGCSVALFGEAGEGRGKSAFVLTGRHVTRRCDGGAEESAAFGGPIFYGHAFESFYEKADHPGNAYWYQAKRANELFSALDGRQRERALLESPRAEEGSKTVRLTGKGRALAGLPVAELLPGQKALFRELMADVLAPFRRADAEKVRGCVERAGGVDALALSYYKSGDIGGDGVWDNWQIEGPALLWFFRGAPHVHVWVHVREGDA